MIIGKTSIKPTKHYQCYHADVPWDLVIKAILTPTKTHLNKRRGKDRFTYIKRYKKYLVEIHTKKDQANNIVWVINAFQTRRLK